MRCNSTYRLRYWNTTTAMITVTNTFFMLQQYLPFTVLKLTGMREFAGLFPVALQQYLPFTVLKLNSSINTFFLFFGCNSTYRLRYWNPLLILLTSSWYISLQQYLPFTVLKLIKLIGATKDSNRLLQQYLPFTVLKPGLIRSMKSYFFMLQQYLPFTVLKLTTVGIWVFNKVFIELQQYLPFTVLKHLY